MTSRPRSSADATRLVIAFACALVLATLLARSIGPEAVTGLLIGGALAGLLGALLRRRTAA